MVHFGDTGTLGWLCGPVFAGSQAKIMAVDVYGNNCKDSEMHADYMVLCFKEGSAIEVDGISNSILRTAAIAYWPKERVLTKSQTDAVLGPMQRLTPVKKERPLDLYKLLKQLLRLFGESGMLQPRVAILLPAEKYSASLMVHEGLAKHSIKRKIKQEIHYVDVWVMPDGPNEKVHSQHSEQGQGNSVSTRKLSP